MINHDSDITSLIYTAPLLKSILLFEVGILIWRIVQWRRRRRVWGELVYRTRTHRLVTAGWILFAAGCIAGAVWGTWVGAEFYRFLLTLGCVPLGLRQLVVFGVAFLWMLTLFIIHGLCGCLMPLEIREHGLCRGGIAFLSWKRISGVYWRDKGHFLTICLDGNMTPVELVAKDEVSEVTEAIRRFAPIWDEEPPRKSWRSRMWATMWMSRRKRLLLVLFSVTLLGNYIPLLADHRREWAVAERLEEAGATVDIVGTYVDSVCFYEKAQPTAQTLQLLARLRGLHWLLIVESVDDALMRHLPPIATLREFSLFRAPITDAALESLAPMESLRVIRLAKTNVTGEGAVHLQGNRELRVLDISDAPITHEGLKTIAKLGQLTNLRFHKAPIEDGWFGSLGDMPRLRTLSFDETPLTDAGVPTLARFKQLRILSLYGTKITDESADALKGMTHLEYLDLSKTGISPEVIEEIRKALPDTEVAPGNPEEAEEGGPMSPLGGGGLTDSDSPPNGQLVP